jgi:hypothetical protein
MRALWTRGFTGEGIWGRGALLSTGEFEKNMVDPGEQLPEHLCGGTYKSRSKKRKAKKTLTYKEQKERRILKKFGANGVALGEDTETKRKLEKGRTVAGKPRVAGSARGRELRAAAALARFDQQKEETVKVESEVDDGSDTESGDDYEDDDTKSEPDAVDIDGKRLLDSKGGRMIKVCEDENPEDQDAQQELRELQSFGSRKPVVKPPNMAPEEAVAKASAAPRTTTNKREKVADQKSTKSPIPKKPPPSESSFSGPIACPICTFVNEQPSATCAMCSSVLDTWSVLDSWTCKSNMCQGTSYRNAGDCGVCGVCGERRPPA